MKWAAMPATLARVKPVHSERLTLRLSKAIVRAIDLDKYEAISSQDGVKEIRGHPPGSLAVADGRLFVGQVFSEVVLVIDLATHAIVKRITLPGGGGGGWQLAVSQDEKEIYFASNRVNQF